MGGTRNIGPVEHQPRTTDPGTLRDGMVWYRSDLDQIRYRSGGTTLVLGPDMLAVPLNRGGVLVVAVGLFKIPLPFDCVYESCTAALGTQATGASAIMDVNYDGTTIFGTQGNRPTFPVSTTLATVGAPSVTSFAAGHLISTDIDQVGSTVPGSNLAGWLILRRTS